jgi:hypothetical protein
MTGVKQLMERRNLTLFGKQTASNASPARRSAPPKPSKSLRRLKRESADSSAPQFFLYLLIY